MEVILDCPFCNKKKHLYYNASKEVYLCFRCGATGKKRSLLANTVLPSANSSKKSARRGTGESSPPSRELSPSTKSYLLNQRGLSSQVLKLVPVLETRSGLLFPFLGEDYWQERKWKPQKPRWRGPSHAKRTATDGIVYLLESHPESRRVVVVEGILDALAVAEFDNAAAVLSWRVHPAQASRLAAQFDECLWMPDADVPPSNLLRSFFRLSARMRTKIWNKYPDGYKDPGDLGAKVGELHDCFC